VKSQPANFRTQERSQTPHRTYLYRFNYEGTNYYYAAYDQDISVNGGPVAKMADPQTFTAAIIGHTNPDESLDSAPQAVTVSLSATDTELRKYFITASPKKIDVEVWRVNSASMPGPLAYASDMKMLFKGIVHSISYDDEIVTAVCITQMLQEDMPIPRFYYQKLCNHHLYDQTPGSCQVNSSLYSASLTIDTLNRPSSYIEFNSLTSINVQDALGNKMGIMVCQPLTGPTRVRLWLSWMPRTLLAGNSVTIFCGCLHIKRVCHTLFANLHRFGATPYVPVSNPALDGITAT
jgi:hypothetical protein